MWKTNAGIWFLRCGIAFSFLYAAWGGFTKPENWIGWFPPVAFALWSWSSESLLMVWGIAEVVLAIWLLSGWKSVAAGFVAAILLIGVTVANLTSIDIVFRDIALALAACGFALSTQKPRTP